VTDAGEEAARDRDAATLGRHYVAGHLEAADLDARLDALYDDATGADALAGLPALEPATPAPVRARRGWWRSRHGETDVAQPGWLPTTERFLDPTTDRVMRVWVEPGTRSRCYVAD
jgi:hypothetical protein